MTASDTATWHGIADQLTDHQRELLTSLEGRFARYQHCDPTRCDELLYICACFYAGLQL
jgi:hypothetical protein